MPRRRAWVPLFALVLTLGCSKSSKETAGAGAPQGPKKETPKDALVVKDITPGIKGGRLFMGIAGDPKTFNPTIVDDAHSQLVSGYIYEALYGFDNILQQEIPALAKTWEYNDATRQWTFHLREGLKWSDGVPLTSDDVLFYTEVIRDPDLPSDEREAYQTGGKPFMFSAPDPLTFVALIPEVDSFAFISLGLVKALPRKKYEQALRDKKFAQILGTNAPPSEIVTSGAFRVKEFKSGERVVLGANPYYYQYDERGTQLPYLDELVLLNVPDFDAMVVRFKAGDLDLIDDPIQPQSLVVLQDGQKKGDYQIYSPGLSLNTNHYWFNQKPGGSYEEGSKRVKWDPPTPEATPPPEILAKAFRYYVEPFKRKWFTNIEFRHASSMATNRDAIVKTVFFGEGAPIYAETPPSNKRWHNPDVPKYPYDMEKAKATLDKIGYIDRDGDGIREDPEGHPIRFTLITNKENNAREKVGVLLKEDMTKLGLGVTLQLLDFNDIITRSSDTFDYEACLLGVASGVPPHPAMMHNTWLSKGRLHNWNPEQKTPATEWEAQLDQKYESLKKVFKYEEQKKIFDEMEVIWAEQMGVIELVSGNLHVAARNKIGNLKPALLRPHLTHNIPQLYIKSR